MLQVTPINLEQANAFVMLWHRHYGPLPGAKFSIAVSDRNYNIRGVAIVGRPKARRLDDGWTLEVNRCCTDGTRNACSMLYGSAWNTAKSLGYRRIVTYTLPEEGGSSLRATGWQEITEVGGGIWNRETRKRNANPHSDNKIKTRWEATIGLPTVPPPTISVAELIHGQYCLIL